MTLRSYLLLVVSAAALAAGAQEPALFNGDFVTGQAIRYEEAPGFYHYVIPCKQIISEGRYDSEVALCWPVNAIRLKVVDGKLDMSRPSQGTLTISATQLRFIPKSATDMDLWFSAPLNQVDLADNPGPVTAIIGSKTAGYKFAFLNVCVLQCASGANPLDMSKTEQFKAEFRNVSDSLKNFGAVYQRVRDMALQVRFFVGPPNQPVPSDPLPAMKLYSELNQRMGQACPQAAKACIAKYAAYQSCEGAPSKTDCGVPPDCTATCTLAPELYRELQAGVCISPSRDSATLFPRWNEVFKKENTERATNPSQNGPATVNVPGIPMAGVAGMRTAGSPLPGWGWLAPMSGGANAIIDTPGRTPPDDSCSVSHIYQRVRSMHVSASTPR